MKSAPLVTLLVTQAASAVIALLVAFGLALTAEQTAAIMGAANFVGIVVGFAIWATTVPRSQVVERLIGDQIVAGEANDLLATGAPVRALGDEPRRAEDWRVEDDLDPRSL